MTDKPKLEPITLPPEGTSYVPVGSLLAKEGEPSFGEARRLTEGEKRLFPKTAIDIGGTGIS